MMDMRRPRRGPTSPVLSVAAVGLLWVLAAGCSPDTAKPAAATPLDRLDRAVQQSQASRSFRVRGELRTGTATVRWEGFVVGADEQYVIQAAGLVMDSRRIAGVSWGRTRDSTEAWTTVPYDAPVDLGVLHRGRLVDPTRGADGATLTLAFHDVDVLRALTHIPSVGDTTAQVDLHNGTVARVLLSLGRSTRAELEFWDYGVALHVDPVPSATETAPRPSGSG